MHGCGPTSHPLALHLTRAPLPVSLPISFFKIKLFSSPKDRSSRIAVGSRVPHGPLHGEFWRGFPFCPCGQVVTGALGKCSPLGRWRLAQALISWVSSVLSWEIRLICPFSLTGVSVGTQRRWFWEAGGPLWKALLPAGTGRGAGEGVYLCSTGGSPPRFCGGGGDDGLLTPGEEGDPQEAVGVQSLWITYTCDVLSPPCDSTSGSSRWNMLEKASAYSSHLPQTALFGLVGSEVAQRGTFLPRHERKPEMQRTWQLNSCQVISVQSGSFLQESFSKMPDGMERCLSAHAQGRAQWGPGEAGLERTWGVRGNVGSHLQHSALLHPTLGD